MVQKAASAAIRAALCLSAIGAGAATGRYTDIARQDARVWSSVAHAAAPRNAHAASAKDRRPEQGAKQTGEAPVLLSAAMTASAEDDDAEDHPARGHGFGEHLRDGAIMTGATPHRLILFTFDDGPDRATTPLLLDRLDAAGVRAVFFLTGANLVGENAAQRRNQEIARETLRRGHVLASHGMHHRQLPLLSDIEALAEVTETEQVFERVLGARPWLLRPPGGAHSPRIDKLLAARGYTTMLWNLGAGDFQVRTEEEVHDTWKKVLERREAQGERGGIILLHDTYAWSVDAFQLIIRDLLSRNCALLAQHEELYDFVDEPALFFAPRGQVDLSEKVPPVVLGAAELEARQARVREETSQRCGTLARF
jgi:peptidoglycan/xylan/chitin deacetylase (PgdA/CDA1 family)